MWPPDSWMYRVHQKKVIPEEQYNISATVAIFVAKLIVLTEEDSDHILLGSSSPATSDSSSYISIRLVREVSGPLPWPRRSYSVNNGEE